jgi:hypothetical protein
LVGAILKKYQLFDQFQQVADYETELAAVWESLSNFTQPNDIYFGHEIEYILELIVNLLDRQDEQKNNTINHLEFQINTTYTGAHILDNLISHDIQWDQLNQVYKSNVKQLNLFKYINCITNFEMTK